MCVCFKEIRWNETSASDSRQGTPKHVATVNIAFLFLINSGLADYGSVCGLLWPTRSKVDSWAAATGTFLSIANSSLSTSYTLQSILLCSDHAQHVAKPPNYRFCQLACALCFDFDACPIHRSSAIVFELNTPWFCHFDNLWKHDFFGYVIRNMNNHLWPPMQRTSIRASTLRPAGYVIGKATAILLLATALHHGEKSVCVCVCVCVCVG